MTTKTEGEEEKKDYQYIVRLKRLGDFNTMFAQDVIGDLNTDKFIKVTVRQKDGVQRTVQLASDSVEAIESFIG